jgi:hypothetical protein
MSAIGSSRRGLPFWVFAALLCSSGLASGEELDMHFTVDPISRLIHVVYRVPEESPQRADRAVLMGPAGRRPGLAAGTRAAAHLADSLGVDPAIRLVAVAPWPDLRAARGRSGAYRCL